MAHADIRSLDLPMLRAFEALLMERSVSKAATRLFLSQPAVSASLKRLREVFDDPLFTRTAVGVQPTARALVLAPHVHASLAQINRLFNAAHAFDPRHSDRIFHVAGSDHSSQLLLKQLSPELTRMGSGIRIAWETASYTDLPDRLRRGDVELGLLPRLTPPPGLQAQCLYRDDYVLITRASDRDQRFDVQAFCERPHVSLGLGRSTLDDRIDFQVEQRGHTRHTRATVGSFAQIVDLVAETDYLAVIPGPVARSHAARIAIHAVPVDLPDYGLYLCHSARFDGDPGLQWMREQLAQVLIESHRATAQAHRVRADQAAPVALTGHQDEEPARVAGVAPVAPVVRTRRRAARPRSA